MVKHFKLVNARDLAIELGAPTSFHQPEQIEWLATLPIEEFFTVGSGKGGRVMVTEETAAHIRNLRPAIKQGRAKREEAPGHEPPPPVPRLPDGYLATLESWRGEMEDLILEQEDRLDGLHRAVEEINKVYVQLKASVDPKANLPEPPVLPPKFKAKVVVGGLPAQAIAHMRTMFPRLQIVHFGGHDRSSRPGRGLPNADLVLCMVSYISHTAQDELIRRYGRENVMRLTGGHSSAESAISVWLAGRDQAEARESP